MPSIRIPLTRGKFTTVDAEDAERVQAFKWHALRSRGMWYARRSPNVRLHRFLLDAPDGVEVDHKNGDGLDNRRENLRLATSAQNRHNTGKRRHNTSGYKGVYPHGGRWTAQIAHQTLGSYASPEEAARAYDTAAREAFGEFARLNFPDSSEAVAPTIGEPRPIGVTGYRGVTERNRPRRKPRWVARISHDGARVQIGVYRTPEDAARAFDAKARELFGESAHLNFPD